MPILSFTHLFKEIQMQFEKDLVKIQMRDFKGCVCLLLACSHEKCHIVHLMNFLWQQFTLAR